MDNKTIKISVSIDVLDIKKAEIFYIKALGCKKKRNQGNMVVLSTSNCDIYLQEKKEKTNSTSLSKKENFRNYGRHWTPVHLDFITKNIEEVVKKIIEFGGEHEGGEKGEWGAIAYCVDPFGNGFCVIDE